MTTDATQIDADPRELEKAAREGYEVVTVADLAVGDRLRFEGKAGRVAYFPVSKITDTPKMRKVTIDGGLFNQETYSMRKATLVARGRNDVPVPVEDNPIGVRLCRATLWFDDGDDPIADGGQSAYFRSEPAAHAWATAQLKAKPAPASDDVWNQGQWYVAFEMGEFADSGLLADEGLVDVEWQGEDRYAIDPLYAWQVFQEGGQG